MQQQENTSAVDAVTANKTFRQGNGKNSSKSSKQEKTEIRDNKSNINCKFCRSFHEIRKCPAFGKQCSNCGRYNHFSIACYSNKVREIRDHDLAPLSDDILLHNVTDFRNERKRWYEKSV